MSWIASAAAHFHRQVVVLLLTQSRLEFGVCGHISGSILVSAAQSILRLNTMLRGCSTLQNVS